jgi:tetratricopeptide (TPR) repeat protein
MTKSINAVLKEAAHHLGQYDLGSALQLYQQALTREPTNAAAGMGLAMVLNRTNRPTEALHLLNRIWAAMIRAKPKLPVAQQAAVLAQIGLAQQELGQLGAALESYRHAARLVNSEDLTRRIKQIAPLVGSPAPVQQLVLHGRQLKAAGQLDDAARTYLGALQLQPDSADVLHELAMVLLQLGMHEKALPLLQKAVILAPDRPEFFNDFGILFQQRSDFSKAVSFHKRAIKLSPGFVFAHINLGVAHKQLGQNEESLAAYRKALELEPNSPEAHSNLGNLLRMMGELKSAKKHLERALTLRPGYVDAAANLDALMKAMANAPVVKAAPDKQAVSTKKAVAKKGLAVTSTAPRKPAPTKAAVAAVAPTKKIAPKKVTLKRVPVKKASSQSSVKAKKK